MLRNLRNSLRLGGIIWVLARHDALHLLADEPTLKWLPSLAPRKIRKRSKGTKLALAVQSLGPSFIKLGQTLGTRFDLIGEEIAKDLASLQDRVPPFPIANMNALIEEELERPFEQLFQSIDPEPIAAASIAQVHKGVTTDGQQVAIKITRPGIETAFKSDIEFFYWLAEFLTRLFPQLKRLKLDKVVATLEQTVQMEMDLRLEAAAANELATNTTNDPGFRIPKVDWQRTSRRIMTMEWIDGVPLRELDHSQISETERREIVERALHAFFNQVFRDGFFHADLHPGNLFIDRDNNLVAVDFGIMGRLDHRNRVYLAELISGFLRRDYRYVAEMHFAAGYVPKNQNIDAFTQACRSIAEPIMDLPLEQISVGRLLSQLFSITETFQMETQPQLILLQKSLVLVEGMCRRLYPQTNMWQMSEPPIRQWMEQNLSMQAQTKKKLEEGVDSLRQLPQMIRRANHLLEKLESGEFSIQAHTGNAPRRFIHIPSLTLGALVLGLVVFLWQAG